MGKEKLETLVKRRLSQRQIAAELECSQTNVRYWLRVFDLITNPLPGVGNGGVGCKAHGVSKCKHCYKGGAHHVAKRRKLMKQRLVSERGGRCENTTCPVSIQYEFHNGDLDFHHLDPRNKLRNLTNWSRSEGELREEAKKCIMVCALCHRSLSRKLHMAKMNMAMPS
jgi:hypothetical protein